MLCVSVIDYSVCVSQFSQYNMVVNSPKKVSPHQEKKLLYFKWVWNKVHYFLIALGHIRKIALLKSHTHPCFCRYIALGLPGHVRSFTSPVAQNLSLHRRIVLGSILSWCAVSFSDTFPRIQQTRYSPWYAEALASCVPTVSNVTTNVN